MPTCKRCGAPIDFIKTPAGKWMPVQPRGVYARQDEGGKRLALDVEGRVVRVSEADKGEPGAMLVRFPHWEFCPAAAEFRQPKAAPAAPPAPAPAPPKPEPTQISFLEDISNGRKTGYWNL